MASEAVSKLQASVTGDSKSARKKKGKSEAGVAVPAAAEPTASEAGAAANGTDSDHSYLRELQKNIRNINKKLNATQKVDAILAANPGVSLDALVAARKINSDQKAQAEKKPGLQAQLAQLEEQYGHYRRYGEELEAKFAKEKEQLAASHARELDALRDTLQAETARAQQKVVKDKLLAFSRFLRAAAARRALVEDDSELSKGFEGALLQVYGGDAAAVVAAEKLIEGTEDRIPSVESVELDVTYGQVKQAVLEEAPFAAEEAWVDDVAQSQAAPPETEKHDEPVSDPTVTHATLDEISTGAADAADAAAVAAAAEPAQQEASAAPAASSIEPKAANAAATAQWDKQASGSDDPLSESYEIIPRDPAETEKPHVVAPVTSTQSWADDAPDGTAAPAPAAGHDGFSEVQHSRGGRGRGIHAGGERGGYRGRGRGGPRGDFRGGRGGGRGRGGGGGGGGEVRGRGGFRGPPRGEPSS